MFERAVCQQMQMMEEPSVSMQALIDLKRLLAMCLPGLRDEDQPQPRLGGADEEETPAGRGIIYDRVLSGGDFVLDKVHVSGTERARFVGRDAMFRPTQIFHGGNTTTLTYDPMGRVESKHLAAGPDWTTWTAVYDTRGQLDREDFDDSVLGTWSNDYTYEEPGWLVEEWRGATGEHLEYVLDDAGRRTETWVDSVLDQQLTWSGSTLTHVDGVAVTYDPLLGTLTDQFGYDFWRAADGRVDGIDDSAGNPLYTFTRDTNGRPVMEEDQFGDFRWTTYGLGGDFPLEVDDPMGGQVTYVEAEGFLIGQEDNVGWVEVVTDNRQNIVRRGAQVGEAGSAFGTDRTPMGDERYLFGALESLPDAPELQMSQQRAYDASTGRFLMPDPIGLDGGLHRSRYANGNPSRFVDPVGYSSKDMGSLGSSGVWAGEGGSTTSCGIECYAKKSRSTYPNKTSAPWILQGSGSDDGDVAPERKSVRERLADLREGIDAHRSRGDGPLKAFAKASGIFGTWTPFGGEAESDPDYLTVVVGAAYEPPAWVQWLRGVGENLKHADAGASLSLFADGFGKQATSDLALGAGQGWIDQEQGQMSPDRQRMFQIGRLGGSIHAIYMGWRLQRLGESVGGAGLVAELPSAASCGVGPPCAGPVGASTTAVLAGGALAGWGTLAGVRGAVSLGGGTAALMSKAKDRRAAERKRTNREKHGDEDWQPPASEEYAKWKAKQAERAGGKDARSKGHDLKERGEPDRTKEVLDEDYGK